MIDFEIVSKLVDMHQAGKSVTDIASETGLSTELVQEMLNQYNAILSNSELLKGLSK